MKKVIFCFFCVFILISFSFIISGEEKPAAKSITKHAIKIGGSTIEYTATAGKIPIMDENNGKVLAEIFFIAYTKNGVTNDSKRPLLFSFNGGPGSSSVWMHMAFLGPRKVLYDDEGFALQPPYELVDNEYSILDKTDIVFIDPVATGYSRMAKGEDLHKYHGVMEDIESVAEFIRMYVTRNNRWDSPKFIIGESYGTTRAAGLTGYLQSRLNMYINGTILVSTMTIGFGPGDDLSYMTILPHYTATAYYHQQLPADLQSKSLREVLDEAEKFAMGDYTLALVKGNKLTPEEISQTADKIARYTGLSKNYIINSNLRVSRTRFRKELLRNQQLTVGRLDSRYKGIDKDAAGEMNEYDPAMAHWSGAFTGTLNTYLREELKYETDLKYNIFGNVRPWKQLQSSRTSMMMRQPSSVGEMLRQAMTQNEYLRVFVLEGYYDGACDYFGAEYSFSHLDVAGKFKDRVKFGFYECGHMMYLRKADLAKAKQDLVDFIDSATKK